MPAVMVLAGPGVVARIGDAVLWAETSDLSPQGLLGAILTEMTARQQRSGAADVLAERVLALLGSERAGSLPAFGFAVPHGTGLLALVAGWGRVVTGTGVLTEPRRLHLLARGWPAAIGRADLAVLTGTDSLLDLGAGVVPGGAALVTPRVAAAESGVAGVAVESMALAGRHPAGPALPATAEPDSGPLAEVIPLRGPRAQLVSARPPLPLAGAASEDSPAPDSPSDQDEPSAGPVKVPGVRCSRQHFNNPIALYCRVCGISMLQQTHLQVTDKRPPLGVLVCDDGATFSLDADYAVGTHPEADERVQTGAVRPLRMGTSNGTVEPAHVLVGCEGWDVVVVNISRQSRAAVWHRDTPQWAELAHGARVILAPGSHVAFGDRRLVFESNTRA
jgi:hypothetical protein